MLAVIPARPQSAGLREIYAVWALLAVDAIAIFVTYSRLDPGELYHVSQNGLRGGASRTIVFFCFPTALAAVAILAITYDRLGGTMAAVTALAGAVLCATVAWPGVVDEEDLDAKWTNGLAGLGALIGVALTLAAIRSGRRERPKATPDGDRARLALGALVVALGIPYVAAELGFFLDDVPGLGSLFITGAIRPEAEAEGGLAPAVHYGHHHGLDGLILALAALLLSRELGAVARTWLRTVLGVYLALLLAYALANMADDLWVEQIVKRGWVGWEPPDLLHPSLSVAWAALLGAGLLIYAAFLRLRR